MESNLVDRISVLNVSNSLKQDRSEKPMSEFQSKPSDHDHAPHDHQQQEQSKKQEAEQSQNITPDHISTPAKQDRKTPPFPEEDESSTNDKDVVVDDDDDGFKTPTSLEHKIPPITECPPAPGRPKPFLKRKVSSRSPSPPPAAARRKIQFTQEQLDMIFWPTFFSPRMRAPKSRKPDDQSD